MASSAFPLWFLVPGAFLSLLTFVGNGLVVYLIITRERLHNTTNWIVLSLAIADFTLGAGYLPAVILLEDHTLVRHSVVSFLPAASALNLSLLTVDRYVFITRPLRYSTLMTTKRAVLLIVPLCRTCYSTSPLQRAIQRVRLEHSSFSILPCSRFRQCSLYRFWPDVFSSSFDAKSDEWKSKWGRCVSIDGLSPAQKRLRTIGEPLRWNLSVVRLQFLNFVIFVKSLLRYILWSPVDMMEQ